MWTLFACGQMVLQFGSIQVSLQKQQFQRGASSLGGQVRRRYFLWTMTQSWNGDCAKRMSLLCPLELKSSRPILREPPATCNSPSNRRHHHRHHHPQTCLAIVVGAALAGHMSSRKRHQFRSFAEEQRTLIIAELHSLRCRFAELHSLRCETHVSRTIAEQQRAPSLSAAR